MKKVDLPAAVKTDPNAQVTAKASLPDSNGYPVVTFYVTSPGAPGLYVRDEEVADC